MKKKILFICSGNTCRSPMAKYLFNNEIQKLDITDYFGDSAGLYCYPGESASTNATAVLSELNINSEEHYSKPATAALLKKAHLIVCMTNSIKNTIQINFPELTSKLFLLKFFVQQSETVEDIADPFGGDIIMYRNTRDEIAECIQRLIKNINKY